MLGEVVENRRGPVERLALSPSVFVDREEQLLQRNDLDLIDAAGGSLGRGVVGAERFDRIADELQANGCRAPGGNKSTTPPRTRELSGLVGRDPGVYSQPRRGDRRDPRGRCRRPTSASSPHLSGGRLASDAARAPGPRPPRDARFRCSARRGPARARRRRRSAAPDRDRDRPHGTETGGRRADASTSDNPSSAA